MAQASWTPDIWTVVSVVIGGCMNFVAAFFIERKRAPRLQLQVEKPFAFYLSPGTPNQLDAQSVRLLVSNDPLSHLLGWIMVRSPAIQCHGVITFHDPKDGKPVHNSPMPARWAGGLQPHAIAIVDPNGRPSGYIQDPERVNVGARMDIYPGETQPLDVAARIAQDAECYGWSNEQYFSQPFGRNPIRKLDRGQWLVRVSVTSSGQKLEGFYRLINDGTRNEFQLKEANVEEKHLIRKNAGP
jgi:hypothetical protein